MQNLHPERMVAIGDAVHPVKPHLGLGAISAIEDAAVLGDLGELFKDVPMSADLDGYVSQRLDLFDKLLTGRVAAYKYHSDVSFFRNAVEEQRHNLRTLFEAGRAPS